MTQIIARGKTFLVVDESTMLAPLDDKYFIAEGLETLAGELLVSQPRVAYLLLQRAVQDRQGH